MGGNFFADNADLQYNFERLDLEEAVEILEDGYRYQEQHPGAPRNYADAKDSYRLVLSVLGEICANRIALRAAEADEEGVHFEGGKVTYAAATQDGLKLLRQAGLMGALLSWEHGGLNLPGSILQMMIEIVSRADPALMSIFGLQEISATVAEYGDEEMKARVLPRFASGEATGAMVLTEPDAGSDLGTLRTRANESVHIRRTENKMGLHASPTCEVEFCDTPGRLLGKRRFGLIRYAMAMMNGARIAVAAQAVGIAEAAYREAYQYAQKRVQFGQSIGAIPAVYRMLLSMRSEIEATRALVYEAGRWVDINKAYDHLKAQGKLSPEGRSRLRQADRLAAVLTPLAKYHATEMGNRVCYQAMQVHGGTGYMREFDVQRHYRDIRVTSIYEGTSQLQIVAATGGLLGHSLDDLLNEWAAQDYGPELAGLKRQVEEATILLNRSIDHLKEQDDRALIDYYAADLADMALYVLTSWLTLRDAQSGERKRELARVYISETMPRFRGRMATIQAIDPTPIQARDVLLSEPF
jgi:alkylation response protein AidB-like acyl-CoA dehydrogenase